MEANKAFFCGHFSVASYLRLLQDRCGSFVVVVVVFLVLFFVAFCKVYILQRNVGLVTKDVSSLGTGVVFNAVFVEWH